MIISSIFNLAKGKIIHNELVNLLECFGKYVGINFQFEKMFKIKVIKRLRYIGIIEGISSLLLFFMAMPLKYIFGLPEFVSVIGMIHGVLFTVYAILTIQSAIVLKRPLYWTFKVFIASIFPFGPFVIEPGLHREQLALIQEKA